MLTGVRHQGIASVSRLALSVGLIVNLTVSTISSASALELQKPPESATPDPQPAADQTAPETPALPTPPASIPNETAPAGPDVAKTDAQLKGPVEVLYDIKKAPPAVAKMREMIVEAAASGDINRLRELMKPGPNQTEVSIGDHPEDPVAVLKDMSGDGDGVEILAILLDILSTGFVHVGQGTKDDVYVWPYFAEKPLATLTPPEKVELMRLVTSGDVADMKEFGGYNFYRVGILPDGTWKFFVAGN